MSMSIQGWRVGLLLVCALGLSTAALVTTSRVVQARGAHSLNGNLKTADEQAIRAARARWNAAVAARDIEALAALFAPDVHVATGAGNASGREDALEGLRQLLLDRPDMEYERTPGRIEGHDGFHLAYEVGTWVERWTNKADGRMTDLSGEYMVMWRNVAGVWLTKAELYVPGSCAGSIYCNPRPPR